MNARMALLPLGWLYGSVAAVRRSLYEHGILHAYRPPVPAVGVGNLAVGGTGKTPHTALIAEILSQKFHTALLSRGYGRTTRGYLPADGTGPQPLSALTVGDEPLLLHRQFPRMPMAVDSNRERGVRNLLSQYPDTEVFVLDDVLQHVSFRPTLRILLTEYGRPYFLDYPMPAGSLREFRRAARIADMVIVTKTDVACGAIDRGAWRRRLKLDGRQQLFFTRYLYDTPCPLTPPARETVPKKSKPVVLLTGIARPEPLAVHLRGEYDDVRHLAFRDHHAFTVKELEAVRRRYCGEGRPEAVFFTTEKDWMRLQSGPLKKIVFSLPFFSLPVRVGFVFEGDRELFIKAIESHVTGETSESRADHCVSEQAQVHQSAHSHCVGFRPGWSDRCDGGS